MRTTYVEKIETSDAVRSLVSGGFLDGGLGFAVMDPQLDRRTLIVLLFPFTDRDLDFHEAFFEIQAQRNDRDTFAARLPHPPVDLATLEEQLARPDRIDVFVSLDPGIGRNMTIQQERFFLHNAHIAVFEIHAPFADGFHFMPHKAQSGFVSVMNEVIVVSLPVLGDHFKCIPDRFGGSRCVFFLFHMLWKLYAKKDAVIAQKTLEVLTMRYFHTSKNAEEGTWLPPLPRNGRSV